MLWSPDTHVPCYFSSLQLPLGWILPDPGPWKGTKKWKETNPPRNNFSLSSTQSSASRPKGKKYRRRQLVSPQASPFLLPTRLSVSKLPFVSIWEAFGLIEHLDWTLPRSEDSYLGAGSSTQTTNVFHILSHCESLALSDAGYPAHSPLILGTDSLTSRSMTVSIVFKDSHCRKGTGSTEKKFVSWEENEKDGPESHTMQRQFKDAHCLLFTLLQELTIWFPVIRCYRGDFPRTEEL